MGNLDAVRDWGYAPEYVEGMWRMLQADEPDDYVLATGAGITVRDFLEIAFEHAGLDWEEHVRFDERYLRPTEVDALIGDPSRARDETGLGSHGRRPRAGAPHGGRRHRGARACGAAVDRHGAAGLVGNAGRSASSRTMTAGVHYSPAELDRDATFYVAGHRGLVGSAIVRRLQAAGFANIIGKTSAELDLRNRDAVFDFFAEAKPRYVVLAAAKVGGILANSTYPVDFLSDNLRIQVNVLDAAREAEVERLLFLGSSCIYPKFAEQPIREESLLTGHLEPTNDAYAIAKIAGILHVQAVRRQYGLPWISAMPTNLYGPNDNFSPTGSHVLPALIRRYDEAVASRCAVGDQLGHRFTAPRVPARRRHGRRLPAPARALRRAGAGQRRHRHGRHDPRDRRDCRRRRRLHRRNRVGHHETRRHTAEAARRLETRAGGLEVEDRLTRRN